MTRFRKASVAVLLVSLTTACADDPIATRPGTPLRSTVVAGTALPQRIPNALKYRTRGTEQAHGRSGSAALYARALINRDGTTSLELSAGDLDAANASGRIRNAQVKLYDDDRLLSTTTYKKIDQGAVAEIMLVGAERNTIVQVQANVTGIDARRSDVVEASVPVKLRPDLSILAIDAPARALTNTPLNIRATVAEVNGDVGAHANCVLYDDGIEIDRANGIWVDAGDAVECAFTTKFATPGQQQLDVVIENPAPADYDGDNNRAAATITVDAGSTMNYQADVSDITYHMERRWTQQWSMDNERHDVFGMYSWDGREQHATLIGSTPAVLQFPLNASIEFSSGGITLGRLAIDDVAEQWQEQWTEGTASYSNSCVWVSTPDSSVMHLYVCAHREFGPGYDRQTTTFDAHRGAVDIVYHSEGYDRGWYRDFNGYTYTTDNNQDWTEHQQYGVFDVLGSDYNIRLTLSDAARTLTANALVPLGNLTTPWAMANTCREYTLASANYYSQNCEERSGTQTGVIGTVTE